jgi:hypothetical protein
MEIEKVIFCDTLVTTGFFSPRVGRVVMFYLITNGTIEDLTMGPRAPGPVLNEVNRHPTERLQRLVDRSGLYGALRV